jgi:hypothetical protein
MFPVFFHSTFGLSGMSCAGTPPMKASARRSAPSFARMALKIRMRGRERVAVALDVALERMQQDSRFFVGQVGGTFAMCELVHISGTKCVLFLTKF